MKIKRYTAEKIPTINRSVLIVENKAIFWEWADSLEEGDIPADQKKERSAYLIDELLSVDEYEDYIKKHFDTIFQSQLIEWDAEMENIPKERSLELFHEWFHCEFASMAMDTLQEPLNKIF
ncbi:hypothetical protein [Sediminitomix flava]|uniref:Uncharacterized protein n=1 Tax=Sediminitomix flava TaxID=379075 RepID=A0A315Z931_SEDFL|nr:hypothetical protein [Sediminitomix flava]PWJ41065.1 hypothetical protein BC781_104340 [Sediminitomix flava]